MTTHSLMGDDSRNLGLIPDASVHLVITHPPAFNAAGEQHALDRFSALPDYEAYLAQLDAVWAECTRVLVPGGHLACGVSPSAGCPESLTLTFDVHAQTRRIGLETRRAIRWLPSDSVVLDGAEFYGRPNQPCGEPLCGGRDVLVMRKPGERTVPLETEVSSRLEADFFATCSSSVWLIPSAAGRHLQCLPVEVAERLIRMFSFVGDTVLDPFASRGTTSAAAMMSGRNSFAVEIEPRYLETMAERMASPGWPYGEITVTKGPPQPAAVSEPVGAPGV